MDTADSLRAAQDSAYWAGAAAIAAWIIGIVSLLVSGGGMWLLWHTLRATRAGVAEASAGNALAVKANKQQLRAYLIVSNARAEGLLPLGFAKLSVDIVNSGQTPARKVRIYYALVFLPAGMKFKFIYGGPSTPPFYLSPGGKVTRSGEDDQVLLTESLDGLRRGEWTYVLAGIVKYEDIFGVTRRTTFRAYVGAQSAKDDGTAALDIDDRHNNFS